ncbi:MAG: hypothetical protein HYX53_04220 [Chloroflexi bacterium]|nr:hypothetical protein [Chloroflexota bacterium]
MKGLGKRASFLAMAAVVAIALLGSAYTLWFEDLTLAANVSTGTLDAQIVCGPPVDNENPFWFPFGVPYANYPPANPLKDVATGPTSAPNGPHEWLLTVGNTYPGYMAGCELHAYNTGTVPWHLEAEQIVITGTDGTSITADCSGSFNSTCTAGSLGIGTNTSGDPVYVQMKNYEGCQVHAPDDLNMSIFVGVNQIAKENTTYTIRLKFRLNQWNESEWLGCGQKKPV